MSNPTRSSSSLTMNRTRSLTARAPTLDQLTLAHILNGETCPPIGFEDFAAFVTHKEFTTENLLFVVWFRSYQHRYNALPHTDRDGVPIPSTRLGDRYTPFAYLDKELEGMIIRPRESISAGLKVDIQAEASGSGTGESNRKRHYKDGEFAPCVGNQCSCGDPSSHAGSSPSKRSFFGRRRSRVHDAEHSYPGPSKITPIIRSSTLHPRLPPSGTKMLGPAEQPMREEAERAFATFLRKGGSRELGISDELRVFAKDTLKRSTAPECFLPIYEEIYHTIETQSLPHFLSQAKENINRPKQLFWYGVGVLDFTIGLTIFLLITLLVPTRNYGYRLIRLPSILFTSFGAMQFYSAMCGFCSQVWGRASRQVKPWEMDILDTDDGMGKDMEEIEGMALRGMAGLGLRGLDKSTVDLGSGEKERIEELEIELPQEVHPLGAFVGVLEMDDPPGGTPTSSSMDPSTSKSTVDTSVFTAIDSPLEEELTEVQLRQLAIRRATIKVPAADLAFPIPSTDSLPVSPITPNSGVAFINSFSSPTVSSYSGKRRSIPAQSPVNPDISPFSESSLVPHSDDPLAYANVKPELGARRSTSSSPSKRSTPADLSALLTTFRHAEPTDPDRFRSTEQEREKAAQLFGPERLIQDPRVKQVMDKVVKEILMAGYIMGGLTVVACFAVPMRL